MASYLEVILWEVREAVRDVICHWADRKLFVPHSMAKLEGRDFRCGQPINCRAVEAIIPDPDQSSCARGASLYPVHDTNKFYSMQIKFTHPHTSGKLIISSYMLAFTCSAVYYRSSFGSFTPSKYNHFATKNNNEIIHAGLPFIF